MITDFNIINPKIDTKKPFYRKDKGVFYFHTKEKYRYYIEASRLNNCNDIEYFLLCGINNFDSNCRVCHTDMYNRCQIRVKGSIKDYIERETNERGNIICSLYGRENGYDIYKLE